LSGKELAEVILNDVREMLEKDGMFSAYAGYGRVGYSLHLIMEMDNLTYPTHKTGVKGGEMPLVSPSESAVALDVTKARQIVSPNAVRILNNLPIKVTSVEGGRIVEHVVTGYDPADVPPQPEPVVTDNSQAATAKIRRRAKGAKEE
jgi:hypothetical protein